MLPAYVMELNVKVTSEGVLIPKELFKEIMEAYAKMEQVLATLEILSDGEALKAIKESREEIARGEYVECPMEDLENILR